MSQTKLDHNSDMMTIASGYCMDRNVEGKEWMDGIRGGREKQLPQF